MATNPFTYLLKFKQTGQVYYGVRYREGCDPSELWTTYFSSSQVIKSMIAEFGKDSFEFEIRRTFDTKKEARDWENTILTKMDAANNPKFLNRSVNLKSIIRGVGTHIWCYHPERKEKKLFKLTEIIADGWIRNNRGPDPKMAGTVICTCDKTGKETRFKSRDEVPAGHTVGRIRSSPTAGTFWITRTDSTETKLIKLGEDIPEGWQKGNSNSLRNKGKTKIWQYLDDGEIKCISISPSELESYMAKGWKPGNPKSAHSIIFSIIDEHYITKQIPSLELPTWLSNGWYSGSPIGYEIEFYDGLIVTLPYQIFLERYGIKHEMIRYSCSENTGSPKYQYKNAKRIGLLG